MKRAVPVACLGVMAILVAACMPAVVVNNRTNFPVRAFVSASGHSQVLSPSPGESSSAEVATGYYVVAVIADQEWVDFAHAMRNFLSDQLTNPEKLTPAQIQDIQRKLKDISARIAAFEKGVDKGAACTGRVSNEVDGLVEVTAQADGKLAISCK